MMAQNPFLDPSKEIQQGKSDEEILAEHERRLAEAAADAVGYRPGPATADGSAGRTSAREYGTVDTDSNSIDDDSRGKWLDGAVGEAMKKAEGDSGTWFDRLKKWGTQKHEPLYQRREKHEPIYEPTYEKGKKRRKVGPYGDNDAVYDL